LFAAKFFSHARTDLNCGLIASRSGMMIERILPSKLIGVRNRYFRRLRHLSQAMLGYLTCVSRQATAKYTVKHAANRQSAATAPRTAPRINSANHHPASLAWLCAIERALAERAGTVREA
jgi:hypothetical protein